MRPVSASRYTSPAAAGRSSTTSRMSTCTAGRPRYVTAVAVPSTSAVEPSARRRRVASRHAGRARRRRVRRRLRHLDPLVGVEEVGQRAAGHRRRKAAGRAASAAPDSRRRRARTPRPRSRRGPTRRAARTAPRSRGGPRPRGASRPGPAGRAAAARPRVAARSPRPRARRPGPAEAEGAGQAPPCRQGQQAGRIVDGLVAPRRGRRETACRSAARGPGEERRGARARVGDPRRRW